ncbi:3-oxoacyl-[acyl-carrier-protein] reductase [Gallibacter intestinalis]|uniref:3-oxoacyl-[acyl-carrier-protein] reductase n=1 Tax=Gallibacter intestinalis TaxID=2779356 RepID=A0ABR9QWS1_9FIRM|nr:3-oxoacyl-[acyl-carrier-protein] reductase [Gallibacter intestinalis]MBE5035311.1 3-oxoacyl-[acyl-carrier-protein] reductase [Gallibacter intestinalis]
MLENKKVMITGGSRGIGRAMAIAMAQAGADVAVIYNGNKEAADKVCEEIRAMGRQAAAFKCDVGNFEEAGKTVQAVNKELGGLDVLVNNAGITKDGLIFTLKEDDFDRVIETNLKGAFNTIKHAAKIMMKNRKGTIINITSVSGMMGNPGQANYAAAKAGMIGLTKTVAKELAARGITCNAIAPGFVATEMTDKLSDEVKDSIDSVVPLKRMAQPEDIANAAVFLASDKASYITGEVLKVDGGLYI